MKWYKLKVGRKIIKFKIGMFRVGYRKINKDHFDISLGFILIIFIRHSMDRNELAKNIYKVSNIRGMFLLRSGKYSTEYFDKYLFESKPDILNAIAEHLSQLIPKDIDALAGLEMGGIPVVTALSLKLDIPCLFVRKKAKEYGTCKLAEGGDIESKHLVIIEDVITSGGAVLDAVKALRELGAIIEKVYCVIDREESGEENLKQAGLKLFPLFKKSELMKGQLNRWRGLYGLYKRN